MSDTRINMGITILPQIKRELEAQAAAEDKAANLRKELRALSEELLRAEAEALLADWLRTQRCALASEWSMHFLQESFDFVGVAVVQPPAAARLEGHRDGHAE
jgi:hypothetical protein